MKKLWLSLCMVFCLLAFGTTIASAKEVSTPPFEYDAEEITLGIQQVFNSWSQADFSQFTQEELATLDPEVAKQYQDWAELASMMGTFESVLETKIINYEDKIVGVVVAKYTNGNIDFKVDIDSNLNISKFDVQKSGEKANGTMLERMEKAFLNTLLGMGVVFLVLIFISFTIYLLKFVPNLFGKPNNKKVEQVVVKNGVDQAIANIAQYEEDTLLEDAQLVAVITAAIMASMGDEAPADGLVVRSIKHHNKKQWQRA